MAGYHWGILDHNTNKVIYFRTEKQMRKVLAELVAEGSGWYVPVYDR